MIPVQHVTRAVILELLQRQPLSPGKVRFAWETAAGPALARATTAELDAHGTLHVRTTSAAWTREVTRSRALLLERLRALLGTEIVTALEVREA
jgi:predicted nucleic acid-binding Zn ribbon protein